MIHVIKRHGTQGPEQGVPVGGGGWQLTKKRGCLCHADSGPVVLKEINI